MTFGEKLQSLRKQKGMSQEQLASQLTVSRQAISKWELDSSSPDIDNVIQLSKIFNVSTDYLLHDEIENSSDAAIETPNITESNGKHFGVSKTILGILFTSIGSIGMLIISVLSSIYPVFISYPMEAGKEDTSFVRTGLPAFLEKYNIEWLFIMCSIVVLAGIVMLVYPSIQAKFKQKRR